jgi:hypothetical protein
MHFFCCARFSFVFFPRLFPTDALWNAAMAFIHQGTAGSVQSDAEDPKSFQVAKIRAEGVVRFLGRQNPGRTA